MPQRCKQCQLAYHMSVLRAGLERRPDPPSVSIATSFDYAVSLDVQVPLIAAAGFTHFSLGADAPPARVAAYRQKPCGSLA